MWVFNMSKHLTFANFVVKNSNFDFVSENLLSQVKKLAIEPTIKALIHLTVMGLFSFQPTNNKYKGANNMKISISN